jgi:hypothetical protein
MTDDNKKEERTLFQYCRDQHLGHLTSIFLDNLVSGLLLGNLVICFCKFLLTLDPGSGMVKIRIRNTACIGKIIMFAVLRIRIRDPGLGAFWPLDLSFVAVFGSGIRDPGSGMGKNQDPGSGINIPDPQHWMFASFSNQWSRSSDLSIRSVYDTERQLSWKATLKASFLLLCLL